MNLRSRVMLLLLFASAMPCLGATQTITTMFQHNADGALTAVTTQVDPQPATMTYLTWDNFTPAAAAPATGTVSAADGNLVGIGSSPGLTAQFAYDVRDRLTACSPAGQPSVSFAYHPASLMASSTLASGDALQFYYDNTATPRMINTRQPSSGLAASFLGPVRYLSDGTEQVLLTPRKDTAGVYDAAAQTLLPYSYDPYGASTATAEQLSTSAPQHVSTSARRHASTSARQYLSTSAQYDLTQNPFQYAGEYQDPTCRTYYLRARWYLPAQQTFLSRDPADGLHRYSYTAGNPVGRTDPSGMKYTGADFSRDVDKLVGKLTPGLWAYIEPVLPVWGQALGGIELVGLLPSFWHHPTTQGYVTFGFLATSMVAEAGGETRALDRLFLFHPGAAFGTRLGLDVALGGSQTAAQSYRHGRLDVPALIQGIDTTLFGMFWARAAGGIGYRPHNLTIDDVDRLAADFHAGGRNPDQALVFAARGRLESPPISFTNPILESKTVGLYHEGLLAVRQRDIMETDVTLHDYNFRNRPEVSGFATRIVVTDLDGSAPSQHVANPGGAYRYIGSFSNRHVEETFMQSPLGVPDYRTQRDFVLQNGRAMDTPYDEYSRNCHDHVAGIIQLLQQPEVELP